MQAYLDGDLSPFYPYHPFDPHAYRVRQAYLAEHYRGDRQALSAALISLNEALGADEVALANARRLAEPDSLTVVTGQQAGLAGGPLFTIHKAITAILLAREQSEQLGVPVIPIFWVASEDHDYAEINRLDLPVDDQIVRVQLPEAPGGRWSVGDLPVPPALPELPLPQTEFTPGVLALLAESRAGSLADWMAAFLTRLFGGTGLVIANPMHPGLRRLLAPFVADALTKGAAVRSALAEACAAWPFTPALETQPENSHLFYYFEGQRQPLASDGEQFWLREEPRVRWSLADLVAEATEQPQRFSPNVVLRPVAQGRLFPDLAYVGGPGEISYHGLLKGVFEVLGGQLPILYPRNGVTLIEPPMARYLDRQGLSLATVAAGLADRREALLAEADQVGLEQLFAELRAQVSALHEGASARVSQLDRGLSAFAIENRRQVMAQLGRFEEKAWQALRKGQEVDLRQLDRLALNLWPHGGPQDRVFSVLPYLAKYGPDLVQRLLAVQTLPRPWQHQVVWL